MSGLEHGHTTGLQSGSKVSNGNALGARTAGGVAPVFPALIAQPIATPTPTIFLTTASDVPTALATNPAPAVFSLAAGVYRMAGSWSVTDGQKLVGDPGGGTILNGALLLTGWTFSAGTWQITGLPAEKTLDPTGAGNTDGTYAFTLHRQDLFVNNVWYKRVASLGALVAGTWFWDTVASIGYMLDNPTGKTVELNNTGLPLQNGINVQCFNLTFTHFANNSSVALNPGDTGWCLLNCVAQYNHGAGFGVGINGVVWNCKALDNGQQGMVAGNASGAQVLNCEIARNNYAGYLIDWEAGGFKFSNSANVLIRGNTVHDNNGVGIWADINNTNWTIDGNWVYNNQGAGIMYEISYGTTTITHNVCTSNGLMGTGWTRAGILIQNSQGVEVSGNTITVDAVNGNGITETHEDRGAGTLGNYDTTNNNIHDNTITYLGAGGASGYEEFGTTNVVGNTHTYDHNHYHAPVPTRGLFSYNLSTGLTFAQFQALGKEAHGTVGT